MGPVAFVMLVQAKKRLEPSTSVSSTSLKAMIAFGCSGSV